jgi:amidase
LGPTDPEIVAGLQRAISVLTSLGHVVEEGCLPDGSVEEFLPLWQHQVAQVPLWNWSRTQPVTRWLGEAGRRLRADDVHGLFDRLNARFAPAFATADAWLMPTVAVPAPRIGAFRGLPAAEAFARASQLGAFTAIINLTGLPAASIPMGRTLAGLPMGLQVVGGPFGEQDVLSLSWELEEALPWQQIADIPGTTL